MQIQNYINHFWLDLDASSSMRRYEETLVNVVDELIAGMAEKSTELEQETRITINTFASRGQRQCLVWDKDVLRMPSIRGLYKAYGWTAMVEAVSQSVDEMLTIPVVYGDHSFVGYVVTDGEENDSRDKYALKPRVSRMGDNWTLAALVPNDTGRQYAERYGFPKDNIDIWDATSIKGVEDVIRRIKTSTSDFMDARTRGVRGTKSLFQLKTVSGSDIKSMLTVVPQQRYRLLNVPYDSRADDFVLDHTGRRIQLGEVYYQFAKPETIQSHKNVALLYEGKVYTGLMREARKLLGLPDESVKVSPDAKPGYTIFVQSTAPNRKLWAGTQVLLMG